MRVLVTGATGLIGRKLCLELLRRGHELVIVGRNREESFRRDFTLPCKYLIWSQLDLLPPVDAAFHLAGDSIAGGRWTAQRKKSILDSRTVTTATLADSFRRKNHWPKTFICASAIGFYGDRGDEILNEASSPGKGFLSEVCQEWERSTEEFKTHSRVVNLRIGVVLDGEGGFLGQMESLFSSGLGGPVGGGRQWLSWIHVGDLLALLLFALEHAVVSGPLNAVAPQPVENQTFATQYAEALHVAALIPTPGLAVKAALGEMSELALGSQKVSSQKAQDLGFRFLFPDLVTALKNLYAWKSRVGERLFRAHQWLPLPLNKVFPFFSEAKNLELITPPFLNFRVVSQSTSKIEKDTLIEYQLKLHGLPVKWRTRISEWKPPHQFVDDQIKGPYKRWHHTHRFESLAGGTWMTDEVIYELPFGALGRVFGGAYVKGDVAKIFAYRQNVIKNLDEKTLSGGSVNH